MERREDKMSIDGNPIQELSNDDLDNVTGGSGFTERRSDVKVMNTGAAPTLGQDNVAAAGNTLSQTGEAGTVEAYCSICNSRRKFMVFSGARGKCTVCGKMRLDL